MTLIVGTMQVDLTIAADELRGPSGGDRIVWPNPLEGEDVTRNFPALASLLEASAQLLRPASKS